MFFVTLLLNQMLAWMRAQSGTTSLRAILYMDEIFGYFPPVAKPPAKAPLLTLLKQARAFGLGVVLATQNPVDLDYKGLANTGTWFLGRLQTERDKARVLEGLEGAAAGAAQRFDRGRMEQILAGLGQRVFLLNNVHEDEPVVFETRWALSYLRGPLTRAQIKTLMDPRRKRPARRRAEAGCRARDAGRARAGRGRCCLPRSRSSSRPRGARPRKPAYRPVVLGVAEVHFADAKSGVVLDRNAGAGRADRRPGGLVGGAGAGLRGRGSRKRAGRRGELRRAAAVGRPGRRAGRRWSKDFATWIYRERALELLRSPATRAVSQPGESEADFRGRLGQLGREGRDRGGREAPAEVRRHAWRRSRSGCAAPSRRSAREKEERRRRDSRRRSPSAPPCWAPCSAARRSRPRRSGGPRRRRATAGRTMKQAGDVGRAKETVAAVEQQIQDLDAELQAELAASAAASDPATEKLETRDRAPEEDRRHRPPRRPGLGPLTGVRSGFAIRLTKANDGPDPEPRRASGAHDAVLEGEASVDDVAGEVEAAVEVEVAGRRGGEGGVERGRDRDAALVHASPHQRDPGRLGDGGDAERRPDRRRTS